jgi:LmbE family N-acetylglucosaminyl deacetylase
MPKSFLRAAIDLGRQIGWDDEEFMSADEVERIGTDDEAITAAVDVTAFVDRKFDALAAHRTQYGTTRWMFEIPEDLRPFAMGTEHFVLARSEVGMPSGRETDLFERTGA